MMSFPDFKSALEYVKAFDGEAPTTAHSSADKSANTKAHGSTDTQMFSGAKYDDDKLDLTLVPPEAIEILAKVRTIGKRKYREAEDWGSVDVERWDKALFRHFIAYLKDPYAIDESGYPAYYHLFCNAMFIAVKRDWMRGEMDAPTKAHSSAERCADSWVDVADASVVLPGFSHDSERGCGSGCGSGSCGSGCDKACGICYDDRVPADVLLNGRCKSHETFHESPTTAHTSAEESDEPNPIDELLGFIHWFLDDCDGD